MLDDVRRDLLDANLALVWVDPVTGTDDRAALDELLREVAEAGVVVSAHPDVILRMGTKEVLYRTRKLGWGSDVDLYRTLQDFRQRFPTRLASSPGPRVLKQYRGNGGIGVWKVELLDHDRGDEPSADARVRVQGARQRDDTTEDIHLHEFIDRCTKYFGYAGGLGRLVDQPFQARITEGIVRCYLVKEEVIGFCRQYPALTKNVFGLPSAKTMFPPDEPAFATLKRNMESEWVAQMQALVDVDTTRLPLLWDIDFLFGPPTDDGTDTYVLCEINVSAVIPFPDTTPKRLAAAALDTIRLKLR